MDVGPLGTLPASTWPRPTLLPPGLPAGGRVPWGSWPGWSPPLLPCLVVSTFSSASVSGVESLICLQADSLGPTVGLGMVGGLSPHLELADWLSHSHPHSGHPADLDSTVTPLWGSGPGFLGPHPSSLGCGMEALGLIPHPEQEPHMWLLFFSRIF